jgi:hypothetical protein
MARVRKVPTAIWEAETPEEVFEIQVSVFQGVGAASTPVTARIYEVRWMVPAVDVSRDEMLVEVSGGRADGEAMRSHAIKWSGLPVEVRDALQKATGWL